MAVTVSEFLRNSITGLASENTIKNTTVVDEYLPKEEGLDKVTIKRDLAVLEIRVSKLSGKLDEKSKGY